VSIVPAHLHSGGARRELGAGEFPFTDEDFGRIAVLLRRESGIHLRESKTALVYSRLTKRLRALRIDSFREYCKLLAASSDERVNMLAALTTNVTRFFREPHHFEHLKSNVLPPLLEAARRGVAVRLWSAGCSSGQEPYSIALTILSLMPEAASHDIRILATDIDPLMVAKGRKGVYGPTELREGDGSKSFPARVAAIFAPIATCAPLSLSGSSISTAIGRCAGCFTRYSAATSLFISTKRPNRSFGAASCRFWRRTAVSISAIPSAYRGPRSRLSTMSTSRLIACAGAPAHEAGSRSRRR
jgi:hypothetical protein